MRASRSSPTRRICGIGEGAEVWRTYHETANRMTLCNALWVFLSDHRCSNSCQGVSDYFVDSLATDRSRALQLGLHGRLPGGAAHSPTPVKAKTSARWAIPKEALRASFLSARARL